jgi:hypothetical protein
MAKAREWLPPPPKEKVRKSPKSDLAGARQPLSDFLRDFEVSLSWG